VLITSLNELAVTINVRPGDTDEETIARISRQVYKDTTCGAWVDKTTVSGPSIPRRYVVRFNDSILGPRATGWRFWGEKTGFKGFRIAPRSLLSYLDPFDKHKYKDFIPLPNDFGRTMAKAQEAIDTCTSDEFRWLNRSALGAYIASITIDEPGEQYPGIAIGSIVEGSDAEVEPQILKFPFSRDDWDNAIANIEEEADRLWLEANDVD
jgi:hypothetical protein